MPAVIWVIAEGRYGYRDDAAKHALVAKLYDLEMNRPPSPSYSAGLEFELTGVAQSVELA